MRGRLLARIVGTECRKLMSYRADFWLNILAGSMAELALAYFIWDAVFRESAAETIGALTFDTMILYYLLAIPLGKLIRGDERQVTLAREIYDGSLTKYLLYPVRYGVFKFATHLGALLPAVIQLGLFLGFIFLHPGAATELHLTAGIVLRAAAAVALANLLSFVLGFAVQGLAFWADSVWSLFVMQRFVAELLGGLMIPLSVFPVAMQELLEWSPFPYLFFFPVMTAMGQVTTTEWLQGIGISAFWCVAISLLGAAVWRRGFRVYTGVGI